MNYFNGIDEVLVEKVSLLKLTYCLNQEENDLSIIYNRMIKVEENYKPFLKICFYQRDRFMDKIII